MQQAKQLSPFTNCSSIHPSIYSTNVYDMPAMYQVPCQVLETKQIKHLICWNLQSSEEQIEHLHDYM